MRPKPWVSPIVPCPVCGERSVLVKELDRYLHADGTDSRECLREIHRGSNGRRYEECRFCGEHAMCTVYRASVMSGIVDGDDFDRYFVCDKPQCKSKWGAK
jgi:hypothetical protein